VFSVMLERYGLIVIDGLQDYWTLLSYFIYL
jgi:hypothetical protein